MTTRMDMEAHSYQRRQADALESIAQDFSELIDTLQVIAKVAEWFAGGWSGVEAEYKKGNHEQD